MDKIIKVLKIVYTTVATFLSFTDKDPRECDAPKRKRKKKKESDENNN